MHASACAFLFNPCTALRPQTALGIDLNHFCPIPIPDVHTGAGLAYTIDLNQYTSPAARSGIRGRDTADERITRQREE